MCCAELLSRVRLLSHGLQPANLLCPWGFSRQEQGSGLPYPPPGDLPNPGIEPRSPALQVETLSSEPSGNLYYKNFIITFSSSWSLSHVQLFATPWTVAHQASLSITNSWSLLTLMSVMPSNHLILCRPLLLLPSTFPSIRVFSNVNSSHQVAKVLEFQLQHQSFQWIFRTDFL